MITYSVSTWLVTIKTITITMITYLEECENAYLQCVYVACVYVGKHSLIPLGR
jgi:hypothetical protein